MQILTVAKHSQDRRTIENSLHDIGCYPTASFARGRETLVYVQNHRIDLVIAARQLQDMDGPSLARAMELQGEADLPVLMICRRIRQDELLDALDQGVDNVLLTPFDQADLREKIAALSTAPPPMPTDPDGGTVFWEDPENSSDSLSGGRTLQVR